jgi:X-X-X-Leu-X-X-Gly heptad repeat protein
MERNARRYAALTGILGTSLTLVFLIAGCSDSTGNLAAGNQELRNGISKARAGSSQYQAGDTAAGLATIQQGRNMMGHGMVMMGLGGCLSDGGVIDGGMTGGCSSMMGSGAIPVLQGTANFDAAHKTMMASSDTGTIDQCLADMETGMQMMEQGATQMMGGMGSKGTMSGM